MNDLILLAENGMHVLNYRSHPAAQRCFERAYMAHNGQTIKALFRLLTMHSRYIKSLNEAHKAQKALKLSRGVTEEGLNLDVPCRQGRIYCQIKRLRILN